MSQDDSKRRASARPRASLPPEVDEIDTSWDDDLQLSFDSTIPEEDAAFERVTAIPEVPASTYVRSAMQAGPKSTPGKPKPGKTKKPPRPRQSELPVSLRDLGGSAKKGEAQAGGEGARSFAPLSLDLSGISDSPLELADIYSEPKPATESLGPSTLEFDISKRRSMPSAASGDPALENMKGRYAVGDFTGALVVAESILEQEPNHPDALRYATSCREVLTQMYSSRIGEMTRVVHVAVPLDEIRWLSLDHRSGFLLSLVDGHSTVEEILDISGMQRLDALRIMYTLLEQHVIGLDDQR